MKVKVLGTGYDIVFKDYKDDLLFKERDIDGYCDDVDKNIVVCNMKSHPNFEKENQDYCDKIERAILRHEIIHAFLSESGLQDNSCVFNGAWAKNEEMIDFFAHQMPKILKCFDELKCAD